VSWIKFNHFSPGEPYHITKFTNAIPIIFLK
jgi:hypothetical protein